jgi:hypothetical protein
MRTPRRIVIVTHARDTRATRRPFMIWGLKEAWERAGIEVVVVRGVDRAVDADVAISHVSLTVTPPEYRQYFARYPVVVNGAATDVSKRRVSRQLVVDGDGWDGPVIVKTDRNFGGLREVEFRGLAARWRPRVRDLWRRLAWSTAPREAEWWRTVERLDPDRYPVFRSVADVPRSVFENSALVVERFLAEREGDLYALRSCAFFGDRQLASRVLSPEPVVKASSTIRQEVEPHPEVLEVRRRLGMNYGKIDYVVHDGQVVVFDANRTPSFGRGGDSARRERVSATLAEGLASL